MPANRVVVTGMGAISALGVGVEPLWTSARMGKTGVSSINFERPGNNRITFAAHITDFTPGDFMESATSSTCDRFSQFAIVAADQAIAQAKLPLRQGTDGHTSVIIGTGIGGFKTIDEMSFAHYIAKTRTDPLTIPRVMSSAAASQISMRYGFTGPTFCVSSACASATQAIGIGAWLIRSGSVDRAIVGGSEASITATYMRAWEALRVLSPDACRPFSKGRNGMVIGEGAAVFVLESSEAATRRGASPIAEIAGYGTTSDSGDLIRPDPIGAAAAMRLAISDAGMTPDDIDYINAHGTATVMNDVAESEALRQVFGDRLAEVAVSSTKPIHGHAIGASGALELVITIMAMRGDVAPPTINWLGPDSKCAFTPVANEARPLPIRAAMSNSLAFGGINACLIVTGVH